MGEEGTLAYYTPLVTFVVCMHCLCVRVCACVRVCVCAGKHGVRCWDLVNWYLQEIEEDIHNEQELLENRLRAKMVIDHLIKHVSLPTHCSSI